MTSLPTESLVPTPPSTPSPSPSPLKASPSVSTKTHSSNDTIEILTARIDTLLVQYLNHLHAYTTATTALNSSVRAGFFDLTRANTSSGGGRGYGMRYGVEGFDARPGRMGIGWRVCWVGKGLLTPGEKGDSNGGNGKGLSVRVERKGGVDVDEKSDGRRREEKGGEKGSDDASGKEVLQAEMETLNLDNKENNQDKTPPAAESKPKARTKTDIKGPIHQLGGLVPPSLRAAQKAFEEVVGEYAPQVVNARAEMERLEGEVRELRRHLKEKEEGGGVKNAAKITEGLHDDGMTG
ncbi:MAG: hypothetical protein Q9160_001443 [Pyrenula sp. 1 TL-2023]